MHTYYTHNKVGVKMVGRSEWIQKHGLYVKGYAASERKIIKKHARKDADGSHITVKKFLIPGIKKAEPLDAYGWITLVSRVGSFAGIAYLAINSIAQMVL
jgi:hypothetical protein